MPFIMLVDVWGLDGGVEEVIDGVTDGKVV
jgi:hypothetical protein